MIRSICILLLFGLIHACSVPEEEGQKKVEERSIDPTNKVILSTDLVWEKLNPARGDQSPQAATIWGDRKGSPATGFLAKFVDGFSSPPHIHNVAYRAVVIKGLIHNDDPNAETMWMKPGSFWTQPAGESHITSAKGEESIALVEIDEGPYLVQPINEAYDNGTRPVNMDASNIVWMGREESHWVDPASEAEISFLPTGQKDESLKSVLIKLPKGYHNRITSGGSVFHAVVIQGGLNYTLPQTNETLALYPGSYFGSSDMADHSVQNTTDDEIIIYVRTNGALKVW